MRTPEEHELVPAIREWLAATGRSSVSPGLSRGEANRQALELLRNGSSVVRSGSLRLDSDGLDVLWALTEELEKRPPEVETFNVCDRVYRQISACSAESDRFGERNELLHRLAKTGWKSAPEGL